MKNLFYLLSFSLLIACSSPNCTNGLQDGTETAIDCGGDCPPCPAPVLVPPVPTYTATELALEGLWQFDYTSYAIVATDGNTYYDTTYAVGGVGCQIDFTFEKPYPSYAYFYSYGGLGGCFYSGQTVWWVNPSSGFVNDSWQIITLTSNLLVLNGTNSANYTSRITYHR